MFWLVGPLLDSLPKSAHFYACSTSDSLNFLLLTFIRLTFTETFAELEFLPTDKDKNEFLFSMSAYLTWLVVRSRIALSNTTPVLERYQRGQPQYKHPKTKGSVAFKTVVPKVSQLSACEMHDCSCVTKTGVEYIAFPRA